MRQMKQYNKEKLASLDEQLQDAEENLGDIEVRNACLAKADFLCSIGKMLASRSHLQLSSAALASSLRLHAHRFMQAHLYHTYGLCMLPKVRHMQETEQLRQKPTG